MVTESRETRNRFYEIVERATGAFLLIATLLIVLQVAARYLFSHAFQWTEELCRYLIIWMVFIEAGVVTAYGIHTVIEISPRWLPFVSWRATQIVAKVFMIAFLSMALYAAPPLITTVAGQISPGLGIPMIIPYSGMFFGIAFMIVVLVVNIRN